MATSSLSSKEKTFGINDDGSTNPGSSSPPMAMSMKRPLPITKIGKHAVPDSEIPHAWR